MVRSAALWLAGTLLLSTSACKKDPGTPEYWDDALNKVHRTSEKVQVLEALSNSPNLKPELLPVLHAHLAAEKSPQTRAAIARVLGQLKSPSSVEPLVSALDGSSSAAETHALNRQ